VITYLSQFYHRFSKETPQSAPVVDANAFSQREDEVRKENERRMKENERRLQEFKQREDDVKKENERRMKENERRLQEYKQQEALRAQQKQQHADKCAKCGEPLVCSIRDCIRDSVALW
jgi:hypothetical protein